MRRCGADEFVTEVSYLDGRTHRFCPFHYERHVAAEEKAQARRAGDDGGEENAAQVAEEVST